MFFKKKFELIWEWLLTHKHCKKCGIVVLCGKGIKYIPLCDKCDE